MNSYETVITGPGCLIAPPIQQMEERNYRLFLNWTYNHRNLFELHVKRGWITDGASIPRFLWAVCGSPYTGTYTVPALLHDGLYAIEAFTRYECDVIFREAMQDWGSGWITRNILYSGVRTGGWAVWNAHTKEGVDHNSTYVSVRIRDKEKCEKIYKSVLTWKKDDVRFAVSQNT